MVSACNLTSLEAERGDRQLGGSLGDESRPCTWLACIPTYAVVSVPAFSSKQAVMLNTPEITVMLQLEAGMAESNSRIPRSKCECVILLARCRLLQPSEERRHFRLKEGGL